MTGFLVIHFTDAPSQSIQIGEPTERQFWRVIEEYEYSYSQLPGFLCTDIYV